MFSISFSDGIKFGFVRSVGVPIKLGQLVIISTVHDSEFAAGKRYPPGRLWIGFEVFAGLEIGAGGAETNLGPLLSQIDLSLAHEDMAARADQPDGKTAVVATPVF
jgi:hypothetical protein